MSEALDAVPDHELVLWVGYDPHGLRRGESCIESRMKLLLVGDEVDPAVPSDAPAEVVLVVVDHLAQGSRTGQHDRT